MEGEVGQVGGPRDRLIGPAEPVDEAGPAELQTLAGAFNRMTATLKHTEAERTLLLAGVSHDLRTPLTRLRMGIEMAADESLREGMTADVEEMDKTIGQFLDFARSEGGEAPQEVDIAALLAEIAGQYLKKGRQVYVEGALRTRKWQDKEGQERYTTEIIATEMQLLGSREGMGGGGGGEEGGYSRESQGGGGRSAGAAPARKPAPAASLGDMDDDIPF